MHRDIARLLVLLAVVRVITIVACPAPVPPPRPPSRREADRQLRHYTTHRQPASPKSHRDRDHASDNYQSDLNISSPPPGGLVTPFTDRPSAVENARASRTAACVSPEPLAETGGGPLAPSQGQRGVFLPPPPPRFVARGRRAQN